MLFFDILNLSRDSNFLFGKKNVPNLIFFSKIREKFMLSNKLCLLLLAISLICTFSIAQQVIFVPEGILPESTLFVASVTNAASFSEELRTTKLWELFQDDEWKEFWASLPIEKELAKFEKDKAKAEQELGMSFESLHKALYGEIILAIPELKVGQEPTVLISWDLGEEKEAFSKCFDKLRQKKNQKRGIKIDKDEITETSEVINGYTVVSVKGPKPVQFTYIHNSLVICNQPQYLNKILTNGLLVEKPLMDSAQYNMVKQKTLQNHPGMFVYLNTNEILKILTKVGQNDEQIQQGLMISQMVGIDTISAISAGITFRNGQVVESVYVYTPTGRGESLFGSLVPSKEIPSTLISSLPTNTILFEHGPCYVNELYKVWKQVMGTLNAEEYESIQKEIQEYEKILGFKVEEVLESLGDEYLFTVSTNGGFIPDTVFQITLKDAAKIQDALKKIGALAPEKFQRTLTWQGHTFTYFNFSSKKEPIPITPAYTIEGNRLIIALYPETLKTILKNQNGKLPEDVKAALQDRTYTELGFLNLKALTVPLYQTGLPLLQAVAPLEEMPFDPALLPSALMLEKYMTNLITIEQYTDEGILCEIHSPTGMIPWLTTAGFVGYHTMQKKHKVRPPRPPKPPKNPEPPKHSKPEPKDDFEDEFDKE